MFLSNTISFVHASKEDSPIKIGNLAVRTAAQPSPLFSIGQNIVDKHNVVIYQTPLYTHGKDFSALNYITSVLYGFSNTFSVYISPTAVRYKTLVDTQCFSSHGIADLPVQFEYAYSTKQFATGSLQATAIATLFIPTGSIKKLPYTGYGSPSFYLGGTLSYTGIDWYAFVDLIGWLTTKNNCQQKFANQLFYEAGIGYNLKYLSEAALLLMLEFNGIYFGRNKNFSEFQQNFVNSGNIIYLGPVLYFATNRIITGFGFQWPIVQKLTGLHATVKNRFSLEFALIF